MTKNNFFRLHFFLRKPYADRAEWPLFVRISAGERRIEFKIGRDVAWGAGIRRAVSARGGARKLRSLTAILNSSGQDCLKSTTGFSVRERI